MDIFCDINTLLELECSQWAGLVRHDNDIKLGISKFLLGGKGKNSFWCLVDFLKRLIGTLTKVPITISGRRLVPVLQGSFSPNEESWGGERRSKKRKKEEKKQREGNVPFDG